MQQLFKCSQIIAPGASATLELLAEYCGAFQPKTVWIQAFNAETKKLELVEIVNVTVMGEPQLVTFDGLTVKETLNG